VRPNAFLQNLPPGGDHCTLSVHVVIFPFTDVFLARPGIGIGALSVPFVIPEFTDVFVSIGMGIGTLSVPFVIQEFTDVFVAIGMSKSAKAK